ncbi:MAG: acetylxylan esterase [Candidatus Hydrogenedentes bacterium]|nr:acetylxylan esterase [Candidatus Hydrogenedentota bacterium]
MTALILAGMCTYLAATDLVWVDTYDACRNGVSIQTEAEYSVWVWARDDETAALAVGDKQFVSDKVEKPKGRQAWRKVGQETLPQGLLKVTLPSSVATLVLTAKPDYVPAAAMQLIRSTDKPEPVQDRRNTVCRDPYTYFALPTFESRTAWETHAARLRRHLLVSSGLYPMPERTPLNSSVSDAITHEDYIVEKVTFESRPGFLVTGNLYRPVGEGPFPAVLCPHGHWDNGRLEDSERASVPARCITFARMGMLAFSYDIIGFVDSKQLPHDILEPVGKLWGVHGFGLQLWNSMRAVDFVESLPYVDKTRIGCTGASGGGTQTFALYGVDDRIRAAAPVNMISCSMQGDCTCESPPLIRMDGASSIDLGALLAPRPLLMVSATGDWTVETPRVEYPAIRSVYALYGAEDRLESVQFDADHNYNKASREAVYRFFAKRLLNEGERYKDFVEPAYQADPPEALRIFPGAAVEDGYPTGDELLRQIREANRAKIEAAFPKDAAGADAFRARYGPALADVFDAVIPESGSLRVERARRYGFKREAGIVSERLVVGRETVGDAIPMILYRPDDAELRDAVLIVDGAGKAAHADLAETRPGALIRALLEKGLCVATIDVFGLGEHNGPMGPPVPRAGGPFLDTFEPTETACRVQDVLTSLAYLRSRRDLSGEAALIGLGDGGLWCLFAGALDGHVGRVAADVNQFPNEDDQAWAGRFYVPSIRSLGDVCAASVLLAPRPVLICNTGDAFQAGPMQSTYKAACGEEMVVHREPVSVETIAAWCGQ